MRRSRIPTFGWDVWFTPMVGGAYETFKEASDYQEQTAVDLDIPIAKQWVELKRSIIEIADSIGIGAEISAMFDVLKAGAVVSYVAPAGTAGAAAALGVTAGVAAGVVGGLVLGALAVFGESGVDAYQRKIDRLKITLQAMLIKPSFASLANAQDKVSAFADQWNDPPLAAAARKLAAFYRLAQATLSPSEAELFLSAMYLARIKAVRNRLATIVQAAAGGDGNSATAMAVVLAAMPGQYQAINPVIALQKLDQTIATATAHFQSLVKKPTTPRKAGPGFGTYAAVAVIGVGGLAIYKPALIAPALGKLKSGAKSSVSYVKLLGSQTLSKLKG